MSGDGIGWKFPPTNGGRVDGFNDPGMAHFSGNPLASLAREIIQNSLDARDPMTADGLSVHVSFEIQEIEKRDALGREDLARAIEACLDEVSETGDDEKAHSMLTEARRLLVRQRLPYLRISDRNTTGLRDKHWRALVKMQGASVKERTDAGGSHGIGKYAPFAVSPLRTVFYWTRFDEGRSSTEKFQGKAVLMSHSVDEVETQGTGFYGLVDRCQELKGELIPNRIRRVEHGGGRGNGTSLWIAGFQTTGAWQKRIARSVVANFFYAIQDGMLTVTVDPDDEPEQRNVEIDRSTIADWFDYLLPSECGDDSEEEEEAIWDAWRFSELLDAGDPTAEKEDNDLGHCRLWIRVSDGLPSKVGFVRGTGMLITTQQRGLLRFSGLRDFIAVCVFDAQKGNELLRKMENPQHNQFEPDRLPEAERRLGHAALKRVCKWIRDEIKKHASPPRSEIATDLDELAKYLPDLEPEDPLDSTEDTGGEDAFGGSPVVRLKPRRRTVRAGAASEGSGVVDDGDGEDAGTFGGGGDGENTGDGGTAFGEGEGSGWGGSGSRGGSTGDERIPVSDVRFVPTETGSNRYRVSFTVHGSGRVRVDFEEAGDSSGIERTDVKALLPNGEISLETLEVTSGQRIEIEVTGTDPIGGRSWRVRATRKDAD